MDEFLISAWIQHFNIVIDVLKYTIEPPFLTKYVTGNSITQSVHKCIDVRYHDCLHGALF